MAYGMQISQRLTGGKKPMSPPKRKDPYRLQALKSKLAPKPPQQPRY